MLNIAEETAKAVAALKAAQKLPIKDDLAKASTWTQSGSPTSGITNYDLEGPAKILVPELTPLRNTIPRVSGKGGIQASWRAVTAVNPSGMQAGIEVGKRGGIMGVTTKDYVANYKGIAIEGWVDDEAVFAAEGFDDLLALNTRTTLMGLMLQEEPILLGGNSDVALNGGAATPTPTLQDNTTGGTLLHSTQYFVKVAALTLFGVQNGTVSANGVQGQVTRPNADGTTTTYGGGTGQISAEANITLGAGVDTRSITASTTAVAGACGYAWFLSTATGTERIVAITSGPVATLTALPAGTNQLASVLGSGDNSTNSTVFDGLIYLAFASGSGSYQATLGSTLTADNAGGIVEINTMLKSLYDTYRLSPTRLLVNTQQAGDISTKILTAGSTGAVRFVFQTTNDMIRGGTMVRSYLNRYMGGGVEIPIEVHPNMPAGMILAITERLPYQMSNVGNVIQVRTRREYTQMLWPKITHNWQFEVRADEVLQHYFPPSLGVISDVRAG